MNTNGTRDKIEKLQRFIVEELNAPPEAIAPDFPLISNKVIDSIGVLQVVSFVEAEFGVDVQDEELIGDNFGSISSIVRMVETKLG